MNIELPQNIKELAHICFNKYDTNKNFSIDTNELKSLLTDISIECGMPEPSENDINRIKFDSDQNHDNKITIKEFEELFKTLYIMKIENKK